MATTKTTFPSDMALKAALWDRPDMTRADVVRTLESPGTSAYYWLLGRFVEYLPVRDVLSLVDRDALYAVFPKLRVWGKLSVEKARVLFSETYRTTT